VVQSVDIAAEVSVEVDVNVQVRGIIDVLSERGLAAMRVLHEEIEAARAAGRLPKLPAAKDEDTAAQ
jgi:hypothetical protein